MPYTAIEDVKTKHSTSWLIAALIRLTLPIRLFCVVEALDEVAQAFGGVRREVVDVRRSGVRSKRRPTSSTSRIDPATNVARASDVAAQAAREIVQRHDLVAARQQRIDDVRADEPGGSGHEGLGAGSGQAAPGYMKAAGTRARGAVRG